MEDGSPLHPRSQRSVVWAILDIGAIGFELSILLHGLVKRSLKLGESPFLGHIDLKIKNVNKIKMGMNVYQVTF